MKLSALFMALTMVVGLMVTPAAASGGVSGVVQDFFEWSVNAQRETGDAFWRAIYGDSWNPDGGFSEGVGADRAELVEKYRSYTNTMQIDLGTTSLVSGGMRVYVVPTNLIDYGCTFDSSLLGSVSSGTFTASSIGSYAGFNYGPYYVPFDCTVTTGHLLSWAPYDYAVVKDSVDQSEPYTRNQGQSITPGKLSINILTDGVGQFITVSGARWVNLYPASSLPTNLDIAEPSRAGSIAGDVYVVNENGEETVYNDYSVVNETTNIYNDPISGTERPMEDWAYDYIERQYNITLEDGANVTIKYGDENIEIVEGDSIETLNYGSGSSGAGGGDDGGGSGIGDAIANLFTVLGEIILGLITALINLATKALDALKGLFDLFGQLVETITGFFGGFTDFLAGVFPFLPEETFTIFNFGLILLVAATVFRKFLK